jgi:uncharacterized protein
MSSLEKASTPVPVASGHQALLASPRHTWTLFGIVMLLTVAGVLNASHGTSASQVGEVPDPGGMIKTNLIVICMLWGWVFFVYRGIQEHGHSLLSFFDFKAFTSGKLASDFAYALLIGGLIYACSTGVHTFMPEPSAQGGNPILSSTPTGLLGIIVWIALSISAGISEEIVFRGYLQRQLTSMTGKLGLAIFLQGLLFGVGHAYEGVSSVIAIVLHGLFLGVLAAWRGNIRAGVIEHVGWDILAGFGFIGANW